MEIYKKYKHKDITEQIIKAFYTVYNTLGYGFLEKVYENALMYELRRSRQKCEAQVPIKVFYGDQMVGEYFADIVVEDAVIIELKATQRINEQHEAQLLNYLKATGFEVGLLLNFGPKPEIKRKAFDNKNKKSADNSH